MYNGGGGPAYTIDNEGNDPELQKQRTGTYNQMTSGTNAVEMVEMDEMN
jgi:hypothetical protein